MTFEEFKKTKSLKNNTVSWWNYSIRIPDCALQIPDAPGCDVDGDVFNGKFVCYALGHWWTWENQ